MLTAFYEKTQTQYTLSLQEWEKLTGISKSTIYQRITRYGWNGNDAVNIDLHSPTRFPYKGQLLTIRELSELSGISPDLLKNRLRNRTAEVAVAQGGRPSLLDKTIEIGAETHTFHEWCLINSIPVWTAYDRVNKHGMDPVRAVTKPHRKKKQLQPPTTEIVGFHA